MKKLKNYVAKFVFVCIVLTLGLFLGSQLEKSNMNKINGSLYNTTKIAIVNLDEGVLYNDENRNFAKEILGDYSGDFQFTGLNDAVAGITDGRYASYVVLPANFSNNVISLNTTPQKSLLKYEISGNLSQMATDLAWQNVMLLKENLNDDIGYLYLSSILGEFHQGQNDALKVLDNDRKDKEVLMAISNIDLIAILDLREVDRLQNDIEELDINPDVEKNEAIINAVDIAYKQYLGESEAQLNSLKKESDAVYKDNDVLKKNVIDTTTLVDSKGKANYTKEKTKVSLDAFNSGLNLYKSDIYNDVMQRVDDEKTLDSAHVVSENDELTKLLSRVQEIHEKYTKSLLETLKTNITKLFDEAKDAEFVFDWTDFTVLDQVIDAKKQKEKEANAQNYIDKVLLHQLLNMDYSLPDLTQEKIILELDKLSDQDEKLRSSLEIYGYKNEPFDSNVQAFRLKDYIDLNKDIYTKIEDINSTTNTDTLKAEISQALSSDVKGLIHKKNESILGKIKTKIDASAKNDIKKLEEDELFKKESLVNIFNMTTVFNMIGLKEKIDEFKSVSINEIEEAIDADLQPLANKQKEEKSVLLSEVEKHMLMNINYHTKLLTYNPLNFINEKEVVGYVKDYERNNLGMKQKINVKNREYTSFVSDSYDIANKQVRSMQEDLLMYQKQSDEKVMEGLGNAKIVREKTSVTNSKLMKGFINKLPYTRIGTVDNTIAYDFITTPNVLEGVKASNTTWQNGIDYVFIMVIFTIVSVVLLMSISICIKYKKTRKSNRIPKYESFEQE